MVDRKAPGLAAGTRLGPDDALSFRYAVSTIVHLQVYMRGNMSYRTIVRRILFLIACAISVAQSKATTESSIFPVFRDWGQLSR